MTPKEEKKLQEVLDKFKSTFGRNKNRKKKLKSLMIMGGRLTIDPVIVAHKNKCIDEIIANMPTISE